MEMMNFTPSLPSLQDAASRSGACHGTVTVSDIRLPLKPFLQLRSEGLNIGRNLIQEKFSHESEQAECLLL